MYLEFLVSVLPNILNLSQRFQSPTAIGHLGSLSMKFMDKSLQGLYVEEFRESDLTPAESDLTSGVDINSLDNIDPCVNVVKEMKHLPPSDAEAIWRLQD